MIIGHGDIAKALIEREDNRLYFASGVSNSQETRESEYQREKDLLSKQDRHKHIVYFSSLCVFYSDSRYAKHKRQMEELIKTFPHYTIMRLGNITWGTNPHTLINAFREGAKAGKPLEIRDVYRYIIVDKDEFLHWIDLIPDWNCEMNITGLRLTVNEIVQRYVYE